VRVPLPRSEIKALSSKRLRQIFPAFSLVTALIGTAASAKPAKAAPPPRSEILADTVRPTAPRLFEGRVLFNPEYLGRIFFAAYRAGEPEIPVELRPVDNRGRAAAYARLYRIDEGLALQIVESALAEGIDPELAFRLVRVESLFRPMARGSMGALGLTQLMPSTARAIDRSLRTESQIMEPVTNLRTGFRYLRQMIERYDGDVRLGLLAYNRGPVAVDRALHEGRDPENGYSPKVLGTAESRYTGEGVIDQAMVLQDRASP
jgi:soluble lytic murein transglycosylase-like protein